MTANREGLVVSHSKQMCIGWGRWDSEHFVLETYVGWLDGWGTSLEIEEKWRQRHCWDPLGIFPNNVV